MITLKSAHEIELMRRAGKITAAARALAGEMVKPGVTTQEIDRAVEHFIRKQGAVPSFLHYQRLSRQRLHQRQRRDHPRHPGYPGACRRATSSAVM